MNPATKSAIYRLPLLGNLARQTRLLWARCARPFDGSASYWEQRYIAGGNSGEGSYGRLAEFKAETINALVESESISSVIEWGCGDGNQLTLGKYPRYIGVDVSQTAVAHCRRRFTGDRTKTFLHLDADAEDRPAESLRAELALSLDVIYHLVEDRVFESYLQTLFNSASRFVLIYSSNKDQAAELPHVRHRQFDVWVAANCPDWSLLRRIPNRFPQRHSHEPETSHADFYLFQKSA